MKKILFGFSMMMLPFLSFAQTGLEGVIVEKYYVANAADNAASVALGDAEPLPVGAITYRIYADMASNYKMLGVHGNTNHTLIMRTSTSFYNNAEASASATPTWNKLGLANNVRLLDSYFAMGTATTQAMTWAVLKTEDAVAGGTNLNLSGTALQNVTPLMGLALTAADGLYTTTTATSPVSFAGFDAQQAILGDGSANGNLITVGVGTPVISGTWYSLNGAVGPAHTGNKVLIAQVTTDGVFDFELNINIQQTTGALLMEKFVARNPIAGETVLSSLIYHNDPNFVPVAPSVSISSPSNGAGFVTGTSIAITANATDANGNATITGVEFFAGATSLGIDATAPYELANWAVPAGATSLTAVARDIDGLSTTSGAVVVNGLANPAPAITNFSVSPSVVKVNRTINFSATVTDNVSVASVVFNYNGVNISGVASGNVYSASANSVLGASSVTITATDNQGVVSTQNASVTVNTNTNPTVSISAPANNSQANINVAVAVSASASDDETVSSVQFFVNGIAQGAADNSSPFELSWVPSAEGQYLITAQATDNDGAISSVSAAVRVNVVDPNSLPYQVSNITKKCSEGDIFDMPVVALKTLSNVIGFDMVMKFNPAKVMPTNIVKINNSLIDSTLATASLNVMGDSILIQVSLNSNAPQNTFFAGSGQVVSVQFAKTASFLPSDTARFSVRKLEESYFTGVVPAVRVGSGYFATYKDSLLNGSLRFWADNSPIRYAAGSNLITNIFGNLNPANVITPDVNGNFVYNINNGQSITINRNIAASTPVQVVINGMDGLLTQKVLLDDASFVPSIYQAIAMDVNMDGRISAGDLSQLSQRSVGRIPEYKQAWNYNNQGQKIVGKGDSKDWLFVTDSTLNFDASYLKSRIYPANDGIGYSKYRVPVLDTLIALPVRDYSGCPTISGQTFRGILLGDVNGSYKSLSPSTTLKSAKVEEGTVVFDFANAIETENSIEVPVYVNANVEVKALDFSMASNNNLEYAGIKEVGNNYSDMSVAGSKVINYFSFGKYVNNKSVAVVRFNKLGNVSSSDIKVNLALINGEKASAKVTEKKLAKQEVVVSVFPNPAVSTLNVMVSEDAVLQIMDMSGKIVSDIKVVANTKEEISVEGLAKGVYMIKVSNDGFVKTQKVIVK